MTPDPDILIRPAVDADGPALADLIRSVFAEYEDCPFVPEEFPELAAPASAFAARRGAMWVAERGGAVVGSLAVAPNQDPGVFELFKVYVAAPERGGGLSARLLERAIAFARAGGGRRIALWSDSRFTRGHAFYLKHGFRRVAGVRALHDAGVTLEFGFARDLDAGPALAARAS
ncbi:GNAT family N-acetyltransferase [Alsobacter sp. SYSU BS001988]|jgi:putative acetyltransferase